GAFEDMHGALPLLDGGTTGVGIEDLELPEIVVRLDAELMLDRDLHRAGRAGEAHEVLERLIPAVVVAVSIGVQDPGRVDSPAPERVPLAAVRGCDMPRGG